MSHLTSSNYDVYIDYSAGLSMTARYIWQYEAPIRLIGRGPCNKETWDKLMIRLSRRQIQQAI